MPHQRCRVHFAGMRCGHVGSYRHADVALHAGPSARRGSLDTCLCTLHRHGMQHRGMGWEWTWELGWTVLHRVFTCTCNLSPSLPHCSSVLQLTPSTHPPLPPLSPLQGTVLPGPLQKEAAVRLTLSAASLLGGPAAPLSEDYSKASDAEEALPALAGREARAAADVYASSLRLQVGQGGCLGVGWGAWGIACRLQAGRLPGGRDWGCGEMVRAPWPGWMRWSFEHNLAPQPPLPPP